jgi:hypothetical protein
MTKNLRGKLFSLFTGAFLGYFWGWILGWSLFDPNSDMWALLAAVGALAGLLLGATPFLWRYIGVFISASAGLYLGWIARTIFLGDRAGGWGILVLLAGSIVGGAVGIRLRAHAQTEGLINPVLIGGLYIGFFGGFGVDVVLLDKVLHLVRTHTVLNQAPAVLACAFVGGALVARWRVSAKPSQL